MSNLMQASRQWASRPDDQRFTSLPEMLAHTRHQREISRPTVISSRRIEARPIETLWDATVGITAYARGVKWQDERVGLEREAGRIMALAK